MSSVPVCYWGEYSDIYTIVTEMFHLKQGHTYQLVKLATNESCYFLSIYSNLNKPWHTCIVTSLISGPVKENLKLKYFDIHKKNLKIDNNTEFQLKSLDTFISIHFNGQRVEILID